MLLGPHGVMNEGTVPLLKLLMMDDRGIGRHKSVETALLNTWSDDLILTP